MAETSITDLVRNDLDCAFGEGSAFLIEQWGLLPEAEIQLRRCYVGMGMDNSPEGAD
jgi:hypothetical protein